MTCNDLNLINHILISTHTLTWSVTVTPSYVAVTSAISTHTLTWSVTLSLPPFRNFFAISTHTLTWSVTKNLCKNISAHAISTHTLTWSVTSRQAVVLTAVKHFNSHAHVERDDRYIRHSCCRGGFQLTRSRGA